MLGYWPYAGKQNIFSFYIFFWCLDENRVFSYRTCIFIVQNTTLQKITDFLNTSLKKTFWMGQTRPKRKMGQNQPKNKMGLLSTGLDFAHPKPHAQ